MKIHGCDIALACASQQALDPSQMGLEAGQVDPRDVMNPILFKACTGEKMNILLDEIYSRQAGISNVFDDGSVKQVFDTKPAALQAYYSLLSDDSFRKTHPQAGLTVMGLKPLVRKIVTTAEFKYAGKDVETDSSEVAQPRLAYTAPVGFGADAINPANGKEMTIPNVFMTNGTTELPAIDTVYEATQSLPKGTGTVEFTKQWLINNIPRIYMGVIVLPPAILQRLFFRMSIRWHISFYEFRPSIDMAPLTGDGAQEHIDGMNETGKFGYYNLYHNATPENKMMNKDYGSFTTNEESEVQKILEKGA